MYNMKKLILLLLISGGLSAQVVVPKSTTTFSNVNAVGSMTVGGNLRVTGSETITGAATLSNSTTIGTGTVAANTSSLGIVRIKQGSSKIDLGEWGSGYAGIWMNNTSNSTSNHVLVSDGSGSYLNGVNTIGFQTNGGTRMTLNSGGVALTGTMSVSGTSTLTGAAKQTNTLNYEGNTTWNTNQTNTLTTGNTGTVAVLSDAVFPVQLQTASSNPSDGVTYYFSSVVNTFNGNSGIANIYIPYNATLVMYNASFFNSGTLASAESASLYLNVDGVATATLNTSITMSSIANTFTGTTSTNVNAGSYVEAKLVCPTWVTNPTNVYASVTFWFVRRQ